MSITSPPKDYSNLFLDMNSFFASVEQQVQPTLRGKPIGVAPYTGATGCIIAASREAKLRGVKIGRVGEMKNLCPDLKIIEARPALYMLYHKEIKKVIGDFCPYFEPLSIDEFVVRLTKREQNRESATRLALEIKRAIRERVGDFLTCSVGIGPSTFLAKMAGERQKPDGLTVVALSELKKFYSELKLTDLVGINWRMEERLKNFGINSPTDFFEKSLPELVALLNHWGRLWFFRLRGYEVDDFIIKNKTIGHSHVLPPELRTKEGAISVLRRLIFKAGKRIRDGGYLAGGIALSIGFLDRGSYHLSRKFPSFSDNKTFLQYVDQLLKDCSWRSRPIYLAVSAFNLKKAEGRQISIFKEIEESRELSLAMDEVNDEFGADTVFPASVFLARNSAPDRIPFGKPRYDILH